MGTSCVKQELTQEVIINAFKMLGIDDPHIREQMNSLSGYLDKLPDYQCKIITADNTFEQNGGGENAKLE